MKKLIVVVMAVLLAGPAWAETPSRLVLPEGARTGERFARVPQGARWQSASSRGSYAKEGALVGAIALGAFGAHAGNQLCKISEEDQACSNGTALAFFTVASAAVGAGVGALLGWAIKKG
jgi:hypothetical protein